MTFASRVATGMFEAAFTDYIANYDCYRNKGRKTNTLPDRSAPNTKIKRSSVSKFAYQIYFFQLFCKNADKSCVLMT